jgi:hypothetical protein
MTPADVLQLLSDSPDDRCCPQAASPERTARAVLLLPAAAEELQAAVALADRAVAAKATTAQWIYP